MNKFTPQTISPTHNKYIENQLNFLSFNNFIVSFSAIIATKKVKTNANKYPKKTIVPKVSDKLSTLKSSTINPPTIIGMLSKKLNSAESFSLFPIKIIAEIVDPDLEIPGKTAKPWTTPTMSAFL